jgi:hypothetical protein
VTDLLLLGIICGFFGLALAFVKACERIIGPDIETPADTRADTDRIAA